MNKNIEVKQPHQWTNADGEVLILKRIPKNRLGHEGFKYPKGVGSVIACPDFNTKPTCGGGIHGWPWGFGIGEGAEFDILEDVWLVLSAPPENVIGELEGGLKCKAKDPVIRFEGSFKDAWGVVAGEQTAIIRNLAASGDDSKLAASGDDSKLAASGNDSNLAASGNDSKLAASGYASKLAASGYASNLAASGNDSVCAVAAACGRVKVGDRGAFAIAYWDNETGWHFVTGKVGEKGIEANVWYTVKDGKLTKDS